MEKPQEQLKRGISRAVLQHGWIPRLCTVARRLSLDDYLRPHPNNSFQSRDPEINSVSDLTRTLSKSHSQPFTRPRVNANHTLVTPLPWDVLKTTAIPSVADLLRRTPHINLPVSSVSAPSFPDAGAANPAINNQRAAERGVIGRQTASLQESATSRPGVQPTGSAASSNSNEQEAVFHVANEIQVTGTATQFAETQTQDAGVQTLLDVSEANTQCKQNTCDVSTETVYLRTSTTATQKAVELTDSEVQAVKEHDTRGTQCTVHTVEIGNQSGVSTKSTTTQVENGTYTDNSVQCERNRQEGDKDGCRFTDSRGKPRDIDQLTNHITELVQQFSNTINSDVAACSQNELVKKRVIEFLNTLHSSTSRDTATVVLPSCESIPAAKKSRPHQTITNGMQIAGQMSPKSVTNLRRYLRDSFKDTTEANHGSSSSSYECPPSNFGLPEEADDTVCGITQGVRRSWVPIGPEAGRSEAQSPLYRFSPQSQKKYQQHQPKGAEHQPATTEKTEKTVSLYDDGTGFRVPDATVPLLQEANITWRLTSDGTCHILGAGSFGSVAAATLRRPDGTSVDVAVKKYRFERDRLSFIREGKMNSFLSDTGVFPEFYGFLHLGPHTNPVICLVSELYGNGTTLVDVLEKNNLGSLRSWLSIAVQLAQGLRKIHQKNVIFNDLKPNNILVNISTPDEPVVKFIDLGMSSYIHGITYNFTTAELMHVPHLAPEVKLKQPTSILSDIWTLGMTYWDMAYVCRLPGLKEVANAALKDNPEDRISLEGIADTLVAIGRCHQLL